MKQIKNLHKYNTQSKHYQICNAKNETWGNKTMRNKGARPWNALPS